MPTTATRLPSAPAPSSSASPSSDSHHIVRERRFSSSMSLSDLLALLRESRATGTLMVDINEGGVGGIRFREERRIDPR